MNADEMKTKVEHDVRALQEYKDEIKKFMVDPSVETFEGMDIEALQLWIVGRKEEYCITFNELSGHYGLAFRNIMGSMVHLGDDGTLADAYDTLISREEERDEPPRKTYKRTMKK